MSLDRSLKTGGGLAKHRNVLSRAERVTRLSEHGKFDMGKDDPTGLPKVANRKVVTAAKTPKKVDAAAAEATPAAPAAAPAAAAKPAGKKSK